MFPDLSIETEKEYLTASIRVLVCCTLAVGSTELPAASSPVCLFSISLSPFEVLAFISFFIVRREKSGAECKPRYGLFHVYTWTLLFPLSREGVSTSTGPNYLYLVNVPTIKEVVVLKIHLDRGLALDIVPFPDVEAGEKRCFDGAITPTAVQKKR